MGTRRRGSKRGAGAQGKFISSTLEFETPAELLEGIVLVLSRAVELRDPYTQGHSERVAEFSLGVAKRMKPPFPESRWSSLRYGALVHDVGKIGLSDYVLNKPALLTKAEFEMVKSHPVLGINLVSPLIRDPIIHAAVLYHHESHDGSGYPYGLVGNEIPLTGRIIRIADMFDALTSDRPYRRAYTWKEALEMMSEQRELFDPHLLDVFTQLISSKFE